MCTYSILKNANTDVQYIKYVRNLCRTFNLTLKDSKRKIEKVSVESSSTIMYSNISTDDLDSNNLLDSDGPLSNSNADVATAIPLDVIAVSEVTSSSEPLKPTEYQDKPFAIAFAFHCLFVVGVALFAGIPALTASSSANVTSSSIISTTPSAAALASKTHVASLISPIGVAVLTALPISFVALYLIQKYAMAAIKCMMVTLIAMKVILSVWFLYSGLIFAGIMTLLFACFSVCFFYFAKNRIAFAAAHLEIACDAVRANPTTVYVAFGTQLLQLIWMLVWCLGLYGIVHEDIRPSYTSSKSGTFLATTFWMFCLYWACNTAQNIAHCTTSGAVGSWWFTTTPTNTVTRSLHRATTTSFGSIAFGSLIVALIQTARFVLKSLERATKKHNFIVCCLRCILNIIEGWVRYFNKYAFVVVALYGTNFKSSGSEVWSLFKTRGWTAIINDDLVELVMSVTCVGIGVITAFIGGLVAFGQSNGALSSVYIPVVISFLIGLFLSNTILGVVDSAVKTCFVCYAKAPLALHTTHPVHFHRITEAWNLFAPDIHQSSGYKNMAVAHAVESQEIQVVSANQVNGFSFKEGEMPDKKNVPGFDGNDPVDSV